MARGYSLSALARDIYNIVYPVNIVIKFDDATDPNVAFPGTTWVQIKDGRVARAATGSTVGTGQNQIGGIAGADSINLSVAQLPVHNHSMTHKHSASSNSTGAHTHNIAVGTGDDGWSAAEQCTFTGYGHATSSAGAHSHTITVDNFTGNTGNQGSGSAINITNASHYYAFWKRTA